MPRRKEAKEASSSVEGQSKMAPPPLPAAQKRGSDRATPTAAGLQRFARAPCKEKGSSTAQAPVSSSSTAQAPVSPSYTAQAPVSPSSTAQAPVSPRSSPDPMAELPPSPTMHTLVVPEVCAPDESPGAAAASSMDATPEPTIRDIFAAVSTCNASLDTLNHHMGDLKSDMVHVRQDLKKITDRVREAETRIGQVEDQLLPLSQAVKSNTQQIAALLLKVDDLENRSRRNNVRLVGVPEKEEGRDPVAFFEKWLADTMGRNILSPFFAIERAHRVPTRAPPPGAPPRPILMKLLHFRDRDAILRAAREKGDITIQGHKVSFYPDFSNEIQKRRMQFLDVKKRLRNIGISYAMQYPARLRVAAQDTTHFFDSPKDAVKWLDINEQTLRRTNPPD